MVFEYATFRFLSHFIYPRRDHKVKVLAKISLLILMVQSSQLLAFKNNLGFIKHQAIDGSYISIYQHLNEDDGSIDGISFEKCAGYFPGEKCSSIGDDFKVYSAEELTELIMSARKKQIENQLNPLLFGPFLGAIYASFFAVKLGVQGVSHILGQTPGVLRNVVSQIRLGANPINLAAIGSNSYAFLISLGQGAMVVGVSSAILTAAVVVMHTLGNVFAPNPDSSIPFKDLFITPLKKQTTVRSLEPMGDMLKAYNKVLGFLPMDVKDSSEPEAVTA